MPPWSLLFGNEYFGWKSVVMENFFKPSKWIVAFCAILIAIWLSLQFVIKARLTEEGKQLAYQIFNWNWPGLYISSSVKDISNVKIDKLTQADAKIEIEGRQNIVTSNGDLNHQVYSIKVLPFKLVIVFYHVNNAWKIGSIIFN